jgi:hypothetical protein
MLSMCDFPEISFVTKWLGIIVQLALLRNSKQQPDGSREAGRAFSKTAMEAE